MADVKVRVVRKSYGSTKPVHQARVCVSFGTFGGMTSNKYTDRDGYVRFDSHDNHCQITVFVDGRDMGKYSCPGRADVTVCLD